MNLPEQSRLVLRTLNRGLEQLDNLFNEGADNEDLTFDQDRAIEELRSTLNSAISAAEDLVLTFSEKSEVG